MTRDTAASNTLRNSYNQTISSLRGQLIEPGHADYDSARQIHNGLINKRPAYIARCVCPEDIAIAIKLARDLNLEVSVRGGGHNVGGRAVTEGGVMIDLSLMRAVKVFPLTRTASVEAGATWADVNSATAEHGLATTGGAVSSTGVAGLTLGGGLGWLMSMYGMTVDNLVSAQVITADGATVTASVREHPDLFWALRGGGGNFGVVSSFTFQLHPVSTVAGGIVAHPLDRAADMLRYYRDVTTAAPDELTLFGALTHAPDGSGTKIGALVGFHPHVEEGMRALTPIRTYGPPILDAMGPMPYSAVNQMLDGGFPRGALSYWKSSFLEKLPDDAIETMVAAFRACPAPLGAILLEHFHGAVTRVPVDATAFPHRTAGYNLLIVSQWLDPAQTESCTQWARDTYESMRPYMANGRYVNYLGDDESNDAVARAYGPVYQRLRKVKTEYDPTNMFRLNQNIQPM